MKCILGTYTVNSISERERKSGKQLLSYPVTTDHRVDFILELSSS